MKTKLFVAVVVIVATGLAVRHMWLNKLAVHSLPARWSVNGEAPWGEVARNGNEGVPVVFWHRVHGGYCFDSVFSKDLRERLTSQHAPTLVVDYNVFADFGRPVRHRVRAVNGTRVDARSRQDSGLILDSPASGPTADCETWLSSDGNHDVR